jgi:ribonuclease-3
MSAKGLANLQERIGWQFADQKLLKRALTHSSLAGTSKIGDLEQLEFLGDRVLGLLTAETLLRRHPKMTEGDLAPRFNALVRKETCARAALAFGLDRLIKMSAQEEESGGRKKKAILGDAAEALLGALYLDGGLDAARKAYDQFWAANLDSLSQRHRDAKTTLQEWSQERGLGAPKYEVVNSEGPAHAPAFTIDVLVKGFEPVRAEGQSKRSAQMAAARAFLVREKVWIADE